MQSSRPRPHRSLYRPYTAPLRVHFQVESQPVEIGPQRLEGNDLACRSRGARDRQADVAHIGANIVGEDPGLSQIVDRLEQVELVGPEPEVLFGP